jgi:hypothetical protein
MADTLAQTSTPPAAPHSRHSDTAQFLDDLFSGQSGRLCLGFIDGDPRIEEMQEEWYDWPRECTTILDRYVFHDQQGHDIYVRMCLFTKRSGKYINALPSRWIWQDEAKIDTPCTMLIESSEGNYQALIELDRLATTEERRRLMTAWRDARDGTDDCSADAVHHIRVPDGHNRKRHGDWLVRYAYRPASDRRQEAPVRIRQTYWTLAKIWYKSRYVQPVGLVLGQH